MLEAATQVLKAATLVLEAATLVPAQMQERAEGDYTSSHVSGGSRFVPWVISKKERAQLPIGTLRKLRKLECEVGQPAESGLCVAPQLGSPASLDGPAGC